MYCFFFCFYNFVEGGARNNMESSRQPERNYAILECLEDWVTQKSQEKHKLVRPAKPYTILQYLIQTNQREEQRRHAARNSRKRKFKEDKGGREGKTETAASF